MRLTVLVGAGTPEEPLRTSVGSVITPQGAHVTQSVCNRLFFIVNVLDLPFASPAAIYRLSMYINYCQISVELRVPAVYCRAKNRF